METDSEARGQRRRGHDNLPTQFALPLLSCFQRALRTNTPRKHDTPPPGSVMPNNRPCANYSTAGVVKRCAFYGLTVARLAYCLKGCQKKHYPRHKEKCEAAGDDRLAFHKAHDTQAVFDQRMERYTTERHNTVDMIPQLRRKLAKATARHGEDSEEVMQARTRLRLAPWIKTLTKPWIPR